MNNYQYLPIINSNPYYVNSSNCVNSSQSTNSAKSQSSNNYSNPAMTQNQENDPDYLLLTPVIFGTVASFFLGFRLHEIGFTSSKPKTQFFIDIYAIIATLGTSAYIYNLLINDHNSYCDIIIPIIITIVFFASNFNLSYALFPCSFSGTIGDNKLSQFLSFLALSVGSISIGDSYGITPKTTGVQILQATEAIFNLFVITLLISLAINK